MQHTAALDSGQVRDNEGGLKVVIHCWERVGIKKVSRIIDEWAGGSHNSDIVCSSHLVFGTECSLLFTIQNLNILALDSLLQFIIFHDQL